MFIVTKVIGGKETLMENEVLGVASSRQEAESIFISSVREYVEKVVIPEELDKEATNTLITNVLNRKESISEEATLDLDTDTFLYISDDLLTECVIEIHKKEEGTKHIALIDNDNTSEFIIIKADKELTKEQMEKDIQEVKDSMPGEYQMSDIISCCGEEIYINEIIYV